MRAARSGSHAGRAGLRAVLVVAGSVAAADAREAHTSFAVTATVQAVTRIESQSAPTRLEISAADVRRGFIDVAQPMALEIHSNSPQGFELDVITVAPLVSAMVIHGLGGELPLGAEGGTLVQRRQSQQRGGPQQRLQDVRLSLKFTLMLVPGLAPGNYPWPMRIAVRPLESS